MAEQHDIEDFLSDNPYLRRTREKGRQQGLAEGLIEGRAKGRAEGQLMARRWNILRP